MGAIATMPVRFRLGELLDERKEKGDTITQTDLSRKSGISMTTINAMVLNKTAQVRLKTLDALCRVLECEPGELLERKRGRG